MDLIDAALQNVNIFDCLERSVNSGENHVFFWLPREAFRFGTIISIYTGRFVEDCQSVLHSLIQMTGYWLSEFSDES